MAQLLRFGCALLVLMLTACASVPVDSNETGGENREAAEYNLQAGVGYLRQQQYQRALVKFEKALQQQPNFLEAGLGKAAALQSIGRQNEAETLYLELIDDFSKRSEPVRAYAGMLCEQQRFQDAERVMLKGLSKGAFEDGAVVYLSLSRCAIRGKRYDLVATYLERATDIEPDNLEIVLQRAWLGYLKGDYYKAKALLEYFESRSPLRADAAQLGYQVAVAQNNVGGMATYGQILRQNYPRVWAQIEANNQSKSPQHP